MLFHFLAPESNADPLNNNSSVHSIKKRRDVDPNSADEEIIFPILYIAVVYGKIVSIDSSLVG